MQPHHALAGQHLAEAGLASRQHGPLDAGQIQSADLLGGEDAVLLPSGDLRPPVGPCEREPGQQQRVFPDRRALFGRQIAAERGGAEVLEEIGVRGEMENPPSGRRTLERALAGVRPRQLQRAAPGLPERLDVVHFASGSREGAELQRVEPPAGGRGAPERRFDTAGRSRPRVEFGASQSQQSKSRTGRTAGDGDVPFGGEVMNRRIALDQVTAVISRQSREANGVDGAIGHDEDPAQALQLRRHGVPDHLAQPAGGLEVAPFAFVPRVEPRIRARLLLPLPNRSLNLFRAANRHDDGSRTTGC